MFGYVKPLKCELKMREWEDYQAAYCGLCHTLKRRCGFFARFVVNYDFTFLALLLSGISGNVYSAERRRCVASPIRRKPVCTCDPAFDFAADASVILAWWKICDAVEDAAGVERLKARIGRRFLRGAYRRAAQRRPAFSSQVRACLDELRQLEKQRVPSLDRADFAELGRRH